MKRLKALKMVGVFPALPKRQDVPLCHIDFFDRFFSEVGSHFEILVQFHSQFLADNEQQYLLARPLHSCFAA